MRDLPNLRQLEYFLALVDTGSFKRASEKCGISQPSMSVQLANLEKRLGTMLVERSRSRIILTPSGREAAVRARTTVEAARALVDWFDAPGNALGGSIRFGASPTLGPYLLPHVIAKLHAGHPDLNLFIEEAAPQSLIDGLARGDHEMILVQLPVRTGDFTTIRLFREPLELVVARDHPFAQRSSVSTADLKGAVMLALGPTYSLHRQVEDLCARFGAQLRGDYQGSSLDALRLMAGMGMGITLLPALYVKSEIGSRDEDVKVVKLEGPRILRSIGLVIRNSTVSREAAQTIAALVQSVARQNFARVLFLEETVAQPEGDTP